MDFEVAKEIFEGINLLKNESALWQKKKEKRGKEEDVKYY